MTLLTATDIRKQFGPRHVLDGATFSLEEGEHIGFVGVNGSGKSTLLRIVAGLDHSEGGALALRRSATIGYLAQDPELNPDHTIRQEMEAALADHQAAVKAYEEVTSRLASPVPGDDPDSLLNRLEALQHTIDHLGGYDLTHLIEGTLTPLGILDPDRLIKPLSGGERKRVAIAKVLLQRPDVLILDEPTNHLDADTVLWLEAELARYSGGILLVTHDRYFLDNVVHRIIEVNEGKLTSYPGQYLDYLEAKEEQANLAEREEDNRQNLMRTELEWLRRGPKARTTKSKSRIQRAEALIDQKGPSRAEAAHIDFGDPARLGKTILHMDKVSKGFAGRTLVKDLSIDLERGEKIGIIGPNGSGKTTLLKMILGEVAPDRGKVELGQNTITLYFDQSRDILDPDKTIREEVADQGDFVDVAGRRMHIVSYLEEFLFPTGSQRMPIRSLSGGERNRVLLAKLMKRKCNLLILDEPTNDLDLLTLQVLEAAISRFQGCVITVTHDRFFLNKVATSILAFEGEGRVVKYVGNYDTYRTLKEQNERGQAAAKAELEAAAKAKAGGKGAGAGGSTGGATGGMEGRGGQGPGAGPETGEGRDRKRVKKLTWAEERELEALPGRIEAGELEQSGIEANLGDPAVFSDATKVRELSARMAALGTELEALYARWGELEAKKE